MFRSDSASYGDGTAQAGMGGFMVGLLCGAAVGAALGVLFAPQSGAELRSQLADSADKLRQRAGDTYDQASRTVNDLVDKGRDAVRQGKEKLDEARTAFNEGYEGGMQQQPRM